MKKQIYEVLYQSGESRIGMPDSIIDFMLANVDGFELYAELLHDDEDETATYEGLKAEILRQAKMAGIEADRLRFYYDD